MLTTQEIRQLQDKEWHEELTKTLHELMKARFHLKSGHSKESHTVKQLKKQVARLQTIKKEQTMEIGKPAQKAIAAKTEKAVKKQKAPSAKSKKI